MTFEGYQKLRGFVGNRPALISMVRFCTKVLPLVCYIVYPIAAAALIILNHPIWLRFIVVPFFALAACTVVRVLINSPRPYEVFDLPALFGKSTVGKSFPSRHCACAAVIALAFLKLYPLIGAFFCIISVLIALSRVLSGVHFIKDVTVGILFGAVFGIIGFFVL